MKYVMWYEIKFMNNFYNELFYLTVEYDKNQDRIYSSESNISECFRFSVVYTFSCKNSKHFSII